MPRFDIFSISLLHCTCITERFIYKSLDELSLVAMVEVSNDQRIELETGTQKQGFRKNRVAPIASIDATDYEGKNCMQTFSQFL